MIAGCGSAACRKRRAKACPIGHENCTFSHCLISLQGAQAEQALIKYGLEHILQSKDVLGARHRPRTCPPGVFEHHFASCLNLKTKDQQSKFEQTQAFRILFLPLLVISPAVSHGVLNTRKDRAWWTKHKHQGLQHIQELEQPLLHCLLGKVPAGAQVNAGATSLAQAAHLRSNSGIAKDFHELHRLSGAEVSIPARVFNVQGFFLLTFRHICIIDRRRQFHASHGERHKADVKVRSNQLEKHALKSQS